MGGGGDLGYKCGPNEMFERMCAWDDQNFVMAAGTKAGDGLTGLLWFWKQFLRRFGQMFGKKVGGELLV